MRNTGSYKLNVCAWCAALEKKKPVKITYTKLWTGKQLKLHFMLDTEYCLAGIYHHTLSVYYCC